MSKPKSASAAVLGAALILCGCGTHVPEIQEPIEDSVSGQQLVEKIVRNIACEVQDAVNALYEGRQSTFLDKWGATVALTFKIEEKSAVSPSFSWIPSIFSLSTGVSASSDATRTDKIGAYYTVQELRGHKACTRPDGAYLLASDLKLREWLRYAITASDTGEVNYASSNKNVISHEVQFEIDTSANLTPGWKLKRVTANQSGSFLSTSRNRNHDLTITLGPDANGQPAPAPAAAALASQIGVDVSNGVKSALQP